MCDRGGDLSDLGYWRMRAVEARARALALARRLSTLAGQIADTEIQVARIHEEIARNTSSTRSIEAAEHASRARRYAEHERQAQREWAARADEEEAKAGDPPMQRDSP